MTSGEGTDATTPHRPLTKALRDGGHVVQGQILKHHQENTCRHAMPRAQAGSRAPFTTAWSLDANI